MSPLRTCVGCRRRDAQEDLLRVALTPAGVIVLDLGRRLPGRGAYLHPQASCLTLARRGRQLERALRAPSGASLDSKLEELGKFGAQPTPAPPRPPGPRPPAEA